MVSARPSLREEQKALTRRRLLDAAGSVFAEKGFRGASVEEIAREAGATTGAVYSNFAGKEDLFLALFEESVAADIAEYTQLAGAGDTIEERTRAAAGRWMEILRQRQTYFPLVIEFWAYAIRRPGVRERFAARFAAFRQAMAQIVTDEAGRHEVSLSPDLAERLGTMTNALGNGLALEKLVDPEAVPDELFGDMLVLIFKGFEALALASEH